MNPESNSHPGIRLAIVLAALACIALEALWSWKRGRDVYNGRETAANFVLITGMQLSKALAVGWQYYWLQLAADFAPTRWPQNALSFGLAFLLLDFLYYWHHRILHEVPVFWTLHHVHHSSPWMNLTTSFRLHWLSPFVSVFFFLPAALLGVPPVYIMIAFALNLLYQFWLHTEAIGSLGILEGWLNTPAAHRVHHGRNASYLDKNYGGVLMVWDRLFGTYVPESERVVYGVTTGFAGHNPLRLLAQGFIDVIQSRLDRAAKASTTAVRNDA